MSDEKALLAAIFAHPDEDAPRLVYADWLDEQGGESNADRAEYIRLAITPTHDGPDYDAKQTRQRELFAKHSRDWYPELFGRKNILRGTGGSPQMARGFPYKLQGKSDALIAAGERLTQLAPFVEFQFLDLTTAGLLRVVSAPWMARIRKAGLSGGWGASQPDYAALADAAHFGEMRDLALSSGWIDRAGAERLAAADPFPKLERFYFGMYSSDDAPAVLFAGKAFAGLRRLNLSGGGGRISGAPMPGLKEVCAAPNLASLTAFDMGWRPTPGLTQMLTRAPFWPNLEELDLLRNDLTDDDLAAFLNMPSRLRKLELDDNKITTEGAEMLAAHPVLANLTHLELSRNKIGDKGFRALLNSPHARNLSKLELNGCGITPAGFTAFAECGNLPNLREVWLSSNTIDLKSARALCASPHLDGLKYLYLGSVNGTAKKELKAKFGPRVSC